MKTISQYLALPRALDVSRGLTRGGAFFMPMDKPENQSGQIVIKEENEPEGEDIIMMPLWRAAAMEQIIASFEDHLHAGGSL